MQDKLLNKSIIAAKEAGNKASSLFGKIVNIKIKGAPTDICSKADLQSEDVIYKTLYDDSLNYLSEERRYIDNKSEYTWVIDPLDGSIPFIAGMEYWGISIGLLKGNKPVLGVINIPSKDWLFYAVKGKGAFLNKSKINVSKEKEYKNSIVGYDVGHKGFRKTDLHKNISSQIEKVRYMPSYACTVYGQVLVAKGVFDAYLHHRAYIWDFCAGSVVVEEAGGKITDHKGKAVDWRKRENISILATNKLLHRKILDEIS